MLDPVIRCALKAPAAVVYDSPGRVHPRWRSSHASIRILSIAKPPSGNQIVLSRPGNAQLSRPGDKNGDSYFRA